jgi:hypothetical protein
MKTYVLALALVLGAGCGDPGGMDELGGGDASTPDGQAAAPDSGTGGAGGSGGPTGSGGAGGSGGSASGGSGGGAGRPGTGGAGGSSTGSGGSAGAGTGGTGSAGTGGAGGGSASAPYCAQEAGLQVSTKSCGFLVQLGQWEYLYKDGIVCADCFVGARRVTGCKVERARGTGQNEAELCVAACRTECCYQRAGATCETDANCCAPLRCKDNGPGRNKSCG